MKLFSPSPKSLAHFGRVLLVRDSGKRLDGLERKGEMNKIFRSTKLVLSAAFFIVFIGSVDTTYAQGNFDQFVSVPNNLPALTVAPENSTEAGNGITLDLSGVASVDANAIASFQWLLAKSRLLRSQKAPSQLPNKLLKRSIQSGTTRNKSNA